MNKKVTHPLRKVLFRELLMDYLECGHIRPTPSDIIGYRYPEKRRCFHCTKGKPAMFDVEKGD
jgi:hypothetical protein